MATACSPPADPRQFDLESRSSRLLQRYRCLRSMRDRGSCTRSADLASRKLPCRACGPGRGPLHDSDHVGLRKKAVTLLGPLEDGLDEFWAWCDAALLEPVNDVRFAAHRADVDDLLAAEELGGYA